MTIAQQAVDTAKVVAERVEPYVPGFAKTGLAYAANTATDAMNYSVKTAVGVKEYAVGSVEYAVGSVVSAKDYAVNTATTAKDYAVTTANTAKDYAVTTANTAKDYAANTASSAKTYASATASNASNYASNTITSVRVAIDGATTTVTAHTPQPIVALVTAAVGFGSRVSADPVATLKGVVPAFVVVAGERTYEVVAHASAATKLHVAQGTGYIITRVNGALESVTAVPAVASLLASLTAISQPILKRFGVRNPDGSVEAHAEADKEQ